MSEQERHFRGDPIDDPSKRPPSEMQAEHRRIVLNLVAGGVLIGIGVVLGVMMAPGSPKEKEKQIAALRADLAGARSRIDELERALTYRAVERPAAKGSLKATDRRRHETHGRRYARALRLAKAQSAAELMEWFIERWNALLDSPQPDDRVSRRAALLALLVGGMGRNLSPDDFVPWQAEFFLDNEWLAELHFDSNGDGLPAERSAPNPKDGFANVSVCHIAMAINQSVTDAQVLVMPEMECDRQDARMSVFLQGRTLNDALDEFVRAVKRESFLVVERMDKGTRLVLVGPGKPEP